MGTVNTAQVKNTGEKLFPELADNFHSAALMMSYAQNEYGADGMSGSAFLSNWAMYNAQVGLFIKTSGKHLDACGATLVTIADTLDWTDEDNAHKLDQPWESSLENEVG